MREIKFRTWDKVNNRWANHNEQLSEVSVSASVNPPSILTVGEEQYEINLFTGLKDKDGKEIYEGDILEHPIGVKAKIGYVPEHGAFLAHYVINDNARYDYLDDVENHCEIVGNIYENPELLTA